MLAVKRNKGRPISLKANHNKQDLCQHEISVPIKLKLINRDLTEAGRDMG